MFGWNPLIKIWFLREFWLSIKIWMVGQLTWFVYWLLYKSNFHANLQALFKAAFFTTFSVLWIYDAVIILVMLKYLVIGALHSSQKETPATVTYTISTIMIMATNFKTIADLTIHVASHSQTCYNLPIMSWKGNNQLWFIVGRVMEYV